LYYVEKNNLIGKFELFYDGAMEVAAKASCDLHLAYEKKVFGNRDNKRFMIAFS
jgi:hypothetical protein